MVKEMVKVSKCTLPTNIAYTDTPMCDPEKGYSNNKIKMTGEYVNDFPEFMESL